MAVVCDDGNVCTTDSCNPQTGCVYTPTIEACDDHNLCTNDGCTLVSCLTQTRFYRERRGRG